MIPDREMASLLLEHHLIDRARLDEAMGLQKRHGGELYTVAIENGLVDEEQTIRLVAQKLSLPCVSLRAFEADPEVLELVPAHLARRHQVIPVGLGDDDSLYLAMANPIDFDAMEEVGQRAGRDVVALLAGPLDIERTLERVYEPPEQAASFALGGLFMAPLAPAAAAEPVELEELDDVLDLPSMDDALEDLGESELLVRSQQIEVEDVLDIYGAPREAMFLEQPDAFLAHEGLSLEGRKRLEEVAQAEDLERVRGGKGQTAAFRGFDDDDDALEPQAVDRGLFAPALPPVPTPQPTPAAPAAAPARRSFAKRELEAAPPRPDPPRPGARIGAAIAAAPQQAEARRMGRGPTLEAALERADTRDILLALARALVKRGVLSEEELLAELGGSTR